MELYTGCTDSCMSSLLLRTVLIRFVLRNECEGDPHGLPLPDPPPLCHLAAFASMLPVLSAGSILPTNKR